MKHAHCCWWPSFSPWCPAGLLDRPALQQTRRRLHRSRRSRAAGMPRHWAPSAGSRTSLFAWQTGSPSPFARMPLPQHQVSVWQRWAGSAAGLPACMMGTCAPPVHLSRSCKRLLLPPCCLPAASFTGHDVEMIRYAARTLGLQEGVNFQFQARQSRPCCHAGRAEVGRRESASAAALYSGQWPVATVPLPAACCCSARLLAR